MAEFPQSVSFRPFVDGYFDVENQLPEYLWEKAKVFFERERKEKETIKSVKEHRARINRLRGHFLRAIGGLPSVKTPLNPKCTGVLFRNGYRIEKIIYESLPGFPVTSLLYVPEQLNGPAPAVLFLCGHSRDAKAYPLYQKVCIDLVKNGFVVLAIDPVGQGERLQYWDPKTKESPVGWGTREHSYEGFQCTLIGANVARYFIWDAVRGIDYLMTRSEVDGSKIGVTGNSGGGTQTAYVMLVDDRVKAAAPCCYITSREAYMRTGQAHDAEQNIYGAIHEGLNYDDFILAFAPKPALIGAAAYDFFCIEGAIQSYERARAVYRLYDAEENVSLVIGKHVHMFSPTLREAVVNWFKRHLKNEPPDFRTGDPPAEPPEVLQVTSTGQVLDDYPNAKTVYHLNLEHWRQRQPARLTLFSRKQLERYVKAARRKLSALLSLPDYSGPLHPRVISENIYDGIKVEKVFFFSEPDVVLTALVMYKDEPAVKRPAVIVLLDEGTNAVQKEKSLILDLISRDLRVVILDVRGVGGVQVRRINSHGLHDIYGTEFKLNYDALMMGTSLTALRTYDVIRGLDYVKTREDIDLSNVSLYGKGFSAIYALLAAALEPGFTALTCEDMLYSFENLVKTRLYNIKYVTGPLVHGLLMHFDIVDLLPLLHGRKYRFINLRNAEGKLVSRDEIEELIRTAERYYPVLENVRKHFLTPSQDG